MHANKDNNRITSKKKKKKEKVGSKINHCRRRKRKICDKEIVRH